MNKKVKIFISLFFIFILSHFCTYSLAKYVIEQTYIVAKIDIDRCKPKIEFLYSTTQSTKTDLITVHLKIIEKNIIKNDFSQNNIKLIVNNEYVQPNFKSFSIISENATEKIYEISFTNTMQESNLQIFIPQGIIEDQSGLTNENTIFTI